MQEVSSGLLATGQRTMPAKKGRIDPDRQNADQDAQDMQSARVGRSTLAKGGTTGNPKRKQARQLNLWAKCPKTDGASDLQSVADNSEALGESQLNSLFGVNSHMF